MRCILSKPCARLAAASFAGWAWFAIGCSAGSVDVNGETSERSAVNLNSDPGLPSGSSGSDQVEVRSTDDRPAAGDGTGAFRTTCLFSHMRHDDPIVHPEQSGSSHLHVFFGNTDADAFSTAESLLTSGNSTCRGGIVNRTAYWVPALLDAGGEPMVPEAAQFYYKSGYNGIAAATIEPVPAGLRMIAGDPSSSATQNDIAAWSCENDADSSSGSIPACDPGTRVVMHVEFPQCWNGLDTDSADHRSHMAYPESGHCPSSHPVPIPAITFNIPYRVPAEGTDGWRLVSDGYDASKPGGYSAHGDWFGAWDPEIAETWTRDCVNAGVDCHSHLLGDGREMYFVGGEP
jgi:hypothetical protein